MRFGSLPSKEMCSRAMGLHCVYSPCTNEDHHNHRMAGYTPFKDPIYECLLGAYLHVRHNMFAKKCRQAQLLHGYTSEYLFQCMLVWCILACTQAAAAKHGHHRNHWMSYLLICPNVSQHISPITLFQELLEEKLLFPINFLSLVVCNIRQIPII
jgi:hypothetical protein